MPDDHSEVVPLLPIPNRTVKRLCADDSADSRVKVGHRQAVIARRPVQGRGVLISAPGWSIDESAERMLQCESSPTTQADAIRQAARESAEATEFDRTLQNLS